MHVGRLPDHEVARLLQSALVHGTGVWQADPVYVAGHVHVHNGCVPENDVALLLQLAALVHAIIVQAGAV